MGLTVDFLQEGPNFCPRTHTTIYCNPYGYKSSVGLQGYGYE